MNPYNNPFPGHDREPDPLRTRRGVETAAKVVRSKVTAWLDDQAPQWVHLALVLEEVDLFDIVDRLWSPNIVVTVTGFIGYTTYVMDIVTHTLDEHPDYHRLATGSHPLLVDGETYAWCVWERDVDEDAQAVLPAPVLGAVA